MSATTPCVPQSCCSTTTTVNIPGSAGASGITTTSAAFTIPAIGGTVAISIGDGSWIGTGKNLFISDGSKFGNFIVTIPGTTSITARFLGLVGDSASGTIASGAIVVPGKGNDTVAWDLNAFTAFTDSTSGVKSDTITATLAKSEVIIPVSLLGITGNVAVAQIVPFAFTVTAVEFRVTKVVTVGAKAATLTAQVNGSSVTGGAVALTSANCTPYGATVTGSPITAGNTGTAGQTLGFISSGVTPFSEGDGFMAFTVTNLDMTATLAAIADKFNTLRAALRHQ